jgi:hypothetical protein
MKHADLVRMIRRGAARAGRGWRRVRQGGEHEIWDPDGLMIVIPRHREVNEVTTGRILRHLESKLGPDWWRR